MTGGEAFWGWVALATLTIGPYLLLALWSLREANPVIALLVVLAIFVLASGL